MGAKREQLKQIVISSVPKTLVKKIDVLAKIEKRSRARQVVVLLEEILARKMATAEAFR